MAAIRNLQLDFLGQDPAARLAKLRVSYEVAFSPLERAISRLRFKENIQLCGKYSPEPEDFLFQLAERRFAANGEDVVRRERVFTVNDSILEEGGIPRRADGLCAKVRVTPRLPDPDFNECGFLSSPP